MLHLNEENLESRIMIEGEKNQESWLRKERLFYFFPTSLTPGWFGLNGCGSACCGCSCGWVCGRGRFWPPWLELGWFVPVGDSSSSSSGAGVVGGGSHPGTVCASSHLKVVGLKASPAGHLWSRGYPPTHNQYLTQLLSIWTAPFGVSLQIAAEEKIKLVNFIG